MNEYWSQQQNVNSTPLLPISRDKTKVEYVEAEPLVTEEEKAAYRARESERVAHQESEEEKTKLRSEIKELHALKNAHLRELDEYRLRQEIYERTVRHFLDQEKNKAPSTIYTTEKETCETRGEVSKVSSAPDLMHGIPKYEYLRIREHMFGKK